MNPELQRAGQRLDSVIMRINQLMALIEEQEQVDEELQGYILIRIIGLSEVMRQSVLSVSQGEIKIGKLIDALRKRLAEANATPV